jgi:hypothetical protein
MTRIFLFLASLDGLALLAAFGVGIASKLQDASRHGAPLYLVHFTLGLFSAIGTLLVHCLIFTYFLGTGRWVKEVTLTYGLADEPWHKETRELKRRTFPPALAAMLIAIATAAGGAGAQLREWPWHVHFTLAILTLGINFWAFRVEYRNVDANSAVLDGLLGEVDRVRAARGLPSNAEALEREERV